MRVQVFRVSAIFRMSAIVVRIVFTEEVIRVGIIGVRWRITALRIVICFWEINIDITTISWIVRPWWPDREWSWVVVLVHKAIVVTSITVVVVITSVSLELNGAGSGEEDRCKVSSHGK